MTSIYKIVKEFSGQFNSLSLSRMYIKLCKGDHLAALLLSQIVYWSDRTDDPDGWFAKTHEDWERELMMTKYQVSRAVDGDPRPSKTEPFKLANIGVKTKRARSKYYGGKTVLHYRIDTDELDKALIEAFEDTTIERGAKVNNVDISTKVNNVDFPLTKNTAKNKRINSKELIAEDGATPSEKEEDDQSPPKPVERKKSDLDKIKSELFTYFVEQAGLTEVTLPKEGAARNKLCYDLLLALYGYYRKEYTDHAGVKTKTKYNYDPAAIESSKRVLKLAIYKMLAERLTIKSVESIKAKMGDVMRDIHKPKSTGKASLLE